VLRGNQGGVEGGKKKIGKVREKPYGIDREIKRKDKRERGGWVAAFWNVAKLCNKNREFWEMLKRWDVMVLTETSVKKRKEGEEQIAKGINGGCKRPQEKKKEGE